MNNSLMKEPILQYKSKVYICKKLPSITDEDMNEVEQYAAPNKKPYFWNVQPVNQSSEVREFGQLVNSMRVAVIPKRIYLGKFTEFDKVYLETKPNNNELDYGDDADYRIYAIRPQNACIRIYFLKIVNNQ